MSIGKKQYDQPTSPYPSKDEKLFETARLFAVALLTTPITGIQESNVDRVVEKSIKFAKALIAGVDQTK